MAKFLPETQARASSYSVLLRHFSRRLFQNDLVHIEDQMKEKVIAGLSILSVLCAFYAHSQLVKYIIKPDMSGSWIELTLFIHFLMAIMGFATMMEWEVLFPDARDRANLLPLPIRTFTLFSAKFSSLLFSAAGMALAMNALAMPVFVFFLPGQHSGSLVYTLRFAAAHITVCLAACLSVFFASVLLIGLLMWICGPRLFTRISIYLRALLMFGFTAQMVLFFSSPARFLSTLFHFNPEIPGAALPLSFPPLWFTGLFQRMLGHPDLRFESLANLAWPAVLAPATAFLLLTYFSYRRESRSGPVTRSFLFSRGSWSSRLEDLMLRHGLRNPTARAIYQFFTLTIKRSLVHRMRFLAFVTAASGLVLIILSYSITTGENLTLINRNMLAIPLLAALILLVGIKDTSALPVAIQANWIFRITETKQKKAYLTGLKMGIAARILAPLAILSGAFFAWFWGMRFALPATAYVMTLTWLLMEALLWNRLRLPFACSCVPGRAKLHIWFSVAFLAILFYGTGFSALGVYLLRNPKAFILYFMTYSALVLGAEAAWGSLFKRPGDLVFFEEPEAVVLTLSGK